MKTPSSFCLRALAFAALAWLIGCATHPGGTDGNAGGWKNLFNGTNLDGWVQLGGQAHFFVEHGAIVGETVTNTPNSFLCPAKTYGDFELELDYQVDAALNSGVQFRSAVLTEERAVEINGNTFNVPPGRVYGYQCEIDMDTQRERWWTAGIYDELRRGWLFPGKLGGDTNQFTADGARLCKPGAWNHLRLLCVGASIKTWLNGEPRADLSDAMTHSGLIGLQVHQIGNDADQAGLRVKFRNVRLREIHIENKVSDPKGGWQMLWDGKTADGWRGAKSEYFPGKGWSMQNGVLSTRENGGAESADGGDIITRQRYADFELELDFRITPGANSGIKIFVQPNLSPIDKVTGKPASVGSAIGMEFQILDDARHPDAKLGHDGDRTVGSLYDLIPAPTDKVVSPVGEWNHARIVSRGQHVEFFLNGRKTVEFDRDSEDFRRRVAASKYQNIPSFGEWADGHILLQDHGNEVSFRDVKIRELK